MLAEQTAEHAYDIHPRLKEALFANREAAQRYPLAPPILRNFLIATEEVRAALIFSATEKDREILIRQISTVEILTSTPATSEEISRVFRKSSATTREDLPSVIEKTWYNSPAHIQERFPLDQIPVSRLSGFPPTYSLLRDNLGSRILERLERIDAGDGFDQIAASLGIKKETLSRNLLLLNDLGIEVPRNPRSPKEYKEIINELRRLGKTEEEDEKVKELLRLIKRHIFYICHQEGILITLTKLARLLGFHASRKNIASFIKTVDEAHIPFQSIEETVRSGPQQGPKQYIVVMVRHFRRIEDALDENEVTHRTRINPVQQVCGEPTQIPTSYQLREGKGYSPVLGTPPLSYSIPIFKENGRYYIPEDQSEALNEYINQSRA